METKGHALAVGTFAIILLGSLFIFILWLSRFEWNDHKQLYAIHFEGSVAGLRVNESVRFHGVPIGHVKHIGINDKGTIHVNVLIEKPHLIRKDSIASIEAQGLTGFSYVQITGGSPDEPLLEKKAGETYPCIPSKQSKIETLFTSMPLILNNIQDISQRIKILLSDQNIQAFESSLNNISLITGQLATSSCSLTKMINGVVQETFMPFVNEAKQTLGSVSDSFKMLQSFMKTHQSSLSDFTHKGLENIQNLVGELRTSNQKIQKIFNEFEASPLEFLKKDTKGVPVAD